MFLLHFLWVLKRLTCFSNGISFALGNKSQMVISATSILIQYCFHKLKFALSLADPGDVPQTRTFSISCRFLKSFANSFVGGSPYSMRRLLDLFLFLFIEWILVATVFNLFSSEVTVICQCCQLYLYEKKT